MRLYEIVHDICSKLTSRHQIVLFLDYDGTLVGIPQKAVPVTLGGAERDLIAQLGLCEGLEVVIISGRTRGYLSKEFFDTPVSLIAEHGAFCRPSRSSDWVDILPLPPLSQLKAAEEFLAHHCASHLGSFVEMKEACLVWHYRRAPTIDSCFVDQIGGRLLDILPAEYEIVRGKAVLEIRPKGCNKGRAVEWYLTRRNETERVQFPIAIGDDVTDEDMFVIANKSFGVSVTVGAEENFSNSQAAYWLASPSEVYTFLQKLLAINHCDFVRPLPGCL